MRELRRTSLNASMRDRFRDLNGRDRVRICDFGHTGMSSLRDAQWRLRLAAEPFVQISSRPTPQMQSELGSPPQDVLGSAREFFRAQILRFAREQLRNDLLAQVRQLRGVAENEIHTRAVGMRVTAAQSRRQPRIFPLQSAQKHSETSVGQISSREKGGAGPGSAGG